MSERTGPGGWMPEGLPVLRGRARLVFLAGWSMLLVLAVSAAVAVLPGIGRAIVAPVAPGGEYGLIPLPGTGTILFAPPFGPARAAGIGPHDQILAVDGHAAPFAPGVVDRYLVAAGGRPIAVTTRSAAGLTAVHRVRAEPGAEDSALRAVKLTPTLLRMGTTGLAWLCETLPLLACAVLLMARRSRDPLAPWASAMMLFMVLGNGQTGRWFATLFSQPVLAFYVANAAAFGLLNVVLAFFPDGSFRPRWTVAVAALGALGAVLSEPLDPGLSNLILVASMLAAVAGVFVRYRRMPPGAGRQQIRWALLGFGASMLSLALLTIIQDLRRYETSFGGFAWTAVAGALFNIGFEMLVIVAITVALLRWRLYGADATISRSVTYGVLTVGLLAVFAASEKLCELGGEHLFGEQLGAVAGALGAAAAAVTIVPLHHRITHWAERRFRSGLAHLRHGLPLLVGDLRETAAPAVLADTMLARVERGVRARHGAVLAGGALLDARDIDADAVTGWAAANPLPSIATVPIAARGDALFPLRVPLTADGVGLVGWLLLGPRPDGSFYGREERVALAEIADPVARALAIALDRDRRDAAHRAEAERVRGEMGDLRRLVTALQQRVGLTAPA